MLIDEEHKYKDTANEYIPDSELLKHFVEFAESKGLQEK